MIRVRSDGTEITRRACNPDTVRLEDVLAHVDKTLGRIDELLERLSDKLG